MKQYMIDELRPQDYETLKSYLDDHLGDGGIGGIYWLPLDSDDPKLLTDTQRAHAGCQPYFFALSLEPTYLACELLVRTQKRVRCDCIAYATVAQRNWLIDHTDAVLEKLDIKI